MEVGFRIREFAISYFTKRDMYKFHIFNQPFSQRAWLLVVKRFKAKFLILLGFLIPRLWRGIRVDCTETLYIIKNKIMERRPPWKVCVRPTFPQIERGLRLTLCG